MRVGFIDSDGNMTIVEAVTLSRELTSTEEPIVWIITNEDGDDFFSKDEELIKNYNELFMQALKDGYIDLRAYDVYCDVGIDEDDDDDWFNDDDEDDSDDDDDDDIEF